MPVSESRPSSELEWSEVNSRPDVISSCCCCCSTSLLVALKMIYSKYYWVMKFLAWWNFLFITWKIASRAERTAKKSLGTSEYTLSVSKVKRLCLYFLRVKLFISFQAIILGVQPKRKNWDQPAWCSTAKTAYLFNVSLQQI